jgi:hypothetical protein
LETGALYDPQSDVWSAMSLEGALPPKATPLAVWAGDLAIIWGSGTGRRYDPALDRWTNMSTQGAPAAAASVIWTGVHAIFWGDLRGGGRYIVSTSTDDDVDGFTVCHGDCDDSDPWSHPDAPEACDGKDNDCDGAVPSSEWDADGDGYTPCGGDCDDASILANPGLFELPGDTRDENCDGITGCNPEVAWKSHGQYVRCVSLACESLMEEGLLTSEQCDLLVAKAARLRLNGG